MFAQLKRQSLNISNLSANAVTKAKIDDIFCISVFIKNRFFVLGFLNYC